MGGEAPRCCRLNRDSGVMLSGRTSTLEYSRGVAGVS